MQTEADPSHPLRGAIARLVAAMMLADRRLSNDEIDEATRLDRIGLGPLSPLVQGEIQRATRMPIDLDDACRALSGTGPALVGTVLSVLAGVAASDGAIDDDERRVFAAIARRLGVGVHDVHDYVEPDEALREVPPAVAAAGSPAPGDDVAGALRALGLGPTANRAEVDAAYLRLVEQYDPVKVARLGPEFVVLAVQKLAALSRLYETARRTTKG
jgi:DnaJ-domain-containing protein 1